MNDIQASLAGLQSKGWTLAALSDEMGNHINTLEKWKAGDTYPANVRGVLLVLAQIARRKAIPKQRRYAPGYRLKAPVVE
jgi:hypothetical protein